MDATCVYATCVDIPMTDGTSVVLIGGAADPTILGLLAETSGSEASYPAQWESPFATPSQSGKLNPREARDFVLRLGTEHEAFKAVWVASGGQPYLRALALHEHVRHPHADDVRHP